METEMVKKPDPVDQQYEPLQDDLIGVVIDNFDGMLTRDAALSVAGDVINWMADEGWLIDLPRCRKKEWDTDAYSCDNKVARPGDELCHLHQEEA